jgi:glycosyltransferase involved in cell wall biosynthesis
MGKENKVKASTIVVTHNRASILIHCIEKLLKQSIRDYEVIVIDDGSTDSTQDLMKKIKDKHFRYFRNEEKKGQPHARNRGIKNSKGDIIIFVDSDVLVDKNFIRDHINLHKRKDSLIVQGMVRHIRKIKDYAKVNWMIDGFCLSGLITQNVSVKKKHLLQAGGFDESFGDTMGYMDVEIGRRLKNKLALKTIYAFRSCLAWHFDGDETDDKIKSIINKSFERGKNAVRFSRKFGKCVAARHVKKSYVDFIIKAFGTEQWVEKKGLKYLVSHKNGFSYPFLKWIIKYHYRGKGIREALREIRSTTEVK